jgi:hypothetical protein
MQKIISLFCRNYGTNHRVRDEIVPGAEWVANGEGVATVKWDGTSCLVKDGVLYKRYDAKHGKVPPPGFIPAQEAPDPVSGHWPGWLKIEASKSSDVWHLDAIAPRTPEDCGLADGTYELVGPRVQGNHHNLTKHKLILHGNDKFSEKPPRTFDGLYDWLIRHAVEGVVWHHQDGRMVKIKRKDFGLMWPIK